MFEVKLEPGEHILLVVRKHWLIYVGMLIPFALVSYLPLFLLDFIATHGIVAQPGMFVTIENPYVRFVLGAWWLIVWMGFFSAFSRNYLDVWVVTNHRIFVIEQHGFFRREVMILTIDNALDVRVHIYGFFPTLFGFGTVDVDSAGPVARHFSMPWIRHPDHIRDTIMTRMMERSKEK